MCDPRKLDWVQRWESTSVSMCCFRNGQIKTKMKKNKTSQGNCNGHNLWRGSVANIQSVHGSPEHILMNSLLHGHFTSIQHSLDFSFSFFLTVGRMYSGLKKGIIQWDQEGAFSENAGNLSPSPKRWSVDGLQEGGYLEKNFCLWRGGRGGRFGKVSHTPWYTSHAPKLRNGNL